MDKHELAGKAFAEGRIEDALRLLNEVLAESETSELWNDWATAQFFGGRIQDAERGYTRSLELDPGNHQAKMNFGVMLWKTGQQDRALPLLNALLPSLPRVEQDLVRGLLSATESSTESYQQGANELERTSCSPLRILIVHDTLPQAGGAGAERRVMQVARVLADMGHQVTVIGRDAVNEKKFGKGLREVGVDYVCGDAERLQLLGREAAAPSWNLEQVLEDKKIDIAILSQLFGAGISVPEQYLDDIRRHRPNARIVILRYDRPDRAAERQAEITGNIEFFEWSKDIAQRQREAWYRSDMVVASTEADAAAIRKAAGSTVVEVVPIVLEPLVTCPKGESRSGVVFGGDLTNAGYVDGLRWLLECVWPLATKLNPTLELHLAIENVPQELQQLLTGFKWSGGRDLAQYLQSARMFVSPLRYGTHAEGFLSMLACGLPGVVTSAVAESVGLDPDIGVLTADSADEFAKAIVSLSGDDRLCEHLALAGQKKVVECHSEQSLRSRWARVIDELRPIQPKAEFGRAFSMLLVESMSASTLQEKTGEKRMLAQLDAYVRLGETLLKERKVEESLEQIRHVFGRLAGKVHRGVFLSQVLTLLKRCYRELGDAERAERCATEARKCAVSQARSTSVADAQGRAGKNKFSISLIVPTFNRLPILKKCMAALEAQTVSRSEFEVIVIDDGSSDGTEEMMRQYHPPFTLQYLRQQNSGTGMARCNGVKHAQGEYLLLMNDDSIFEKDVIEQHLKVQRANRDQRWAVLGNFEYPKPEANKRALTHFFCIEPFMFPQVMMEEGCPYGYSHFITCNLSVRRDAVVDAGSFDPTYKLSEDTEMGIRLYERGYRVLFHPAAHAWHDHLPYAMGNLIRRARVYGADYYYMFQRHPRVMKEWALPVELTAMDEENAVRILEYVKRNRADVEQSVAALERWDHVDFDALVEKDPSVSALVMRLFGQALPAVHWFYLMETMFKTMTRNLGLESLAAQADLSAAEAIGLAAHTGRS